MWVQAGWATQCPRVAALLLLLVFGSGVSTQDICSSRAEGTLQAPVLFLNASRAQEGDVVLAQCVLQNQFPATRIVFCKDGLEVYSMKAQEGRVINSMLLSITEGSSGTYRCLYLQRNEKNWLRSSALSPPRDLHVTGHVSSSTKGTAPTVIAVTSLVFTLLLSVATFWTIKKGACRERCRRQQHVSSQQMEATDYGEIQYAAIVHFQRDRKNGKS
ncbi:uncharacterized protein LOC104916165 isoform X1 [Meleagris gallopavo]|uniref:uncharacterized protein LOC104916165 isoform X1 n=1 Tax=Meleagris gallopavo TaxID=9103 RepID=UPI000549BAB4|nr:uncharacterized protein LOC104916165 isoform X1 [Meleagris gallopavo]